MKLVMAIAAFMIAGLFLAISYGVANGCADRTAKNVTVDAPTQEFQSFVDNAQALGNAPCASFPRFAKFLAGGAIIFGLIFLLIPNVQKEY